MTCERLQRIADLTSGRIEIGCADAERSVGCGLGLGFWWWVMVVVASGWLPRGHWSSSVLGSLAVK